MAPTKGKKKADAPDDEPKIAGELSNTKPQEVDMEEDKKGSVTVRWIGGERTYSKEVHGTDYKKLAAQFSEKMKERKVLL